MGYSIGILGVALWLLVVLGGLLWLAFEVDGCVLSEAEGYYKGNDR